MRRALSTVVAVLALSACGDNEEAELQSQGVDVTAEMFERDAAGFTEDYDPNAEPGLAADAAGAADTDSER